MKYLLVLLSIGMLSPGCVHVPIEKRYGELQTNIKERTGYDATWAGVNRSEDEIANAIRTMLADELTAEEAVHITLLYNHDLQATYSEFGIALADLMQAGLPPNPVAEIALRFQEDSEFDLRSLEVIVVQDFLDIFMIPLHKKVAENEFERVKLQVTYDLIEYATETRIAYYQLQGMLQKLEMMQQALIAAESSMEMAARLFAVGNIPETAMLAERVRYERTKLAVAELQTRTIEQRELLNQKMGLWGEDIGWHAEVRLPPLPEEKINLEGFEQRAVAASLDLQIAWRGIEATARRNRIKMVKAVVPELSLGAEFERETEVETELHKNARGEQELQSSEGPDLWWRGPSIAVPLPIFDQGQAARTRGQMAVRREWDKFTSLAVRLRSTARLARYRLEYTRDLVNNYWEVQLPLNVRLRTQTQLRYNAMFLGVFQLLEAKRQEIETGQRYIDSLLEYWIARARAEQILLGAMGSGTKVASRETAKMPAAMGGAEGGH